MNEKLQNEEREHHAIVSLLSYWRKVRELEVSDEEISACLAEEKPLPAEYVEALKQPIDPEKIRKTLTGEYHPTMPPSVEGLVRRLRKAHSQCDERLPIIQIKGYPEFIQKNKLSLAASEKSVPMKSFELRVLDGEVILDVQFESDMQHVSIYVWDKSGEPSSSLDNAEILDIGMNVLAKIEKSSAQIIARAIENGLILRQASGEFLETK